MAVGGLALRQDLNARPAVGQDPAANKVGRKVRQGHRLRIETAAKLLEIVNQGWNESSFGPGPRRGIRLGQAHQQIGNQPSGLRAGPGCVRCSF
jgi:hypothetical protein